MDILIAIGLILLTLGLAALTWLSIPGTVIMAGVTLLIAWGGDWQTISGGQVVFIVALVAGLELLELVLGGIATQLAGAEKRTLVFAILGGITGTVLLAPVLLPVGALLGLLGGSYLGAYISEAAAGKPGRQAARAALGAVVGNVVSKILKSAAVLVIGIWLVIRLT